MQALKEWAVACRALEQGLQIVILRKGGIMEYRNGFQVKHSNFWLFPTFEHQSKESVKPRFWPLLDFVMERAGEGGQIVLGSFAKVAHVFEISNPAGLKPLDEFHIWSPDYISKRMAYNPAKPMSVLILRVYKANEILNITNREEWAGCRSWVPLDAEAKGSPVLADFEFEALSSRVKEALSLPA